MLQATSISSRKSFRGRRGRRLGGGVSRPFSSSFIKGGEIPLPPASGPLLPRKDLFIGAVAQRRAEAPQSTLCNRVCHDRRKAGSLSRPLARHGPANHTARFLERHRHRS